MAYGDLPTHGFGDPASSSSSRCDSRRDLSKVYEVDGKDPRQVQESIADSWYAYSDGDGAARHPWDGETQFNYTGPKPPYEQLDVAGGILAQDPAVEWTPHGGWAAGAIVGRLCHRSRGD